MKTAFTYLFLLSSISIWGQDKFVMKENPKFDTHIEYDLKNRIFEKDLLLKREENYYKNTKSNKIRVRLKTNFEKPFKIISSICNNLSGEGIIFSDDVTIFGSKFQSLDFSLTFFKRVTLIQSNELNSVNFMYSDLQNILDFKDNQVKGLALFSNAKTKNIWLRGNNFNSANFSKLQNNGEFILTSSTFEMDANFRNVEFGRILDLSDTKFLSNVSFENALMPDTLKLIKTTFIQNIDFTPTIVKGNKCVVYFTDNSFVDLGKYILPSNKFTLGFDNKNTYEQKASCYKQIIGKCDSLGLKDSVEGWSIEYTKVSNVNYYGNFLGNTWNFIQESWWGFGYQRWKILVFTLIFYLIFVVINSFFLKDLISKVYYDSDLGSSFLPKDVNSSEKLITYIDDSSKKKKIKFPIINRFLKRLPYSFHYTGVIFFGLKVKHEALNVKNFLIIYFYTIYLIGIIHIAFIISYILSK